MTPNADGRAEVIASRYVNASKSPDKYVLGNSLVINLKENNNKSIDQRRLFQTQYTVKKNSGNTVSIFPSTTTATTANTISEPNDHRVSNKGDTPHTMHQRFRSLHYNPGPSNIQN